MIFFPAKRPMSRLWRHGFMVLQHYIGFVKSFDTIEFFAKPNAAEDCAGNRNGHADHRGHWIRTWGPRRWFFCCGLISNFARNKAPIALCIVAHCGSSGPEKTAFLLRRRVDTCCSENLWLSEDRAREHAVGGAQVSSTRQRGTALSIYTVSSKIRNYIT